MTPPADLAALIDRAGTVTAYCSCYACKAIAPLILPARLALERVEAISRDRDGLRHTLDAWVAECGEGGPRPIKARLARLEEYVASEAGLDCREYDKHLSPRPCGACSSCRARAALEGK